VALANLLSGSIGEIEDCEIVHVGRNYESDREVAGESILVDAINFHGTGVGVESIDKPRNVAPILETDIKYSTEMLDNYSFMNTIDREIRVLLLEILRHLRAGKNPGCGLLYPNPYQLLN
jgi:hypothetical protein